MGRIGRSYPRFDQPDRDTDTEQDPSAPSSLTSGEGDYRVRGIALAVIWVLGILAVLAWALRLYR